MHGTMHACLYRRAYIGKYAKHRAVHLKQLGLGGLMHLRTSQFKLPHTKHQTLDE